MMSHPVVRIALVTLSSVLLATASGIASDHADPMSLDPFAIQSTPEANITDLHAFVVDRDGTLVTGGDPLSPDNRLVVSLCVRRALLPGDQEMRLDFEGYTFRVHLDLAPPVRFADPNELAATPTADPEIERDRSMQALYGGIITHPTNIADTATMEFQLARDDHDGEPSDVRVASAHVEGMDGRVQPVRWRQGERPPADEIGITAGVFDDPFIFPRFFRKDVVGIVTSIPLKVLLPTWPSGDGPVPILLWATTHEGARQIDHVGRSLRTQLPRFGSLNTLPPWQHVREITRVHAEPTLMEDVLTTFVSPLFAHRHYDSVPDVMIYDLRRPAQFPNGRALQDDVAKTLADAGETLLLELSYAESRQFPRAVVNDKAFRPTFPYLADRWTQDTVDGPASATIAAQPPDKAAIAMPNFDASIWRRLAVSAASALVVLTLLLVRAVRSNRVRLALVVVALLVGWSIHAVYADTVPVPAAGAAAVPLHKAYRILAALGWAGALSIGLVFAIGRRSVTALSGTVRRFPRGLQSPTEDDARQSSHGEIHSALFDPLQSGQYYETWGHPGSGPLPIHPTTFASITAGILGVRDGSFAMLSAARRTLRTRGDLRWGDDRKGFRRLVHPMGVCLAGTWSIDGARSGYTGLFAPGARGRVIARYSLGGNDPRNGRKRSLGLVGKVFPSQDAPDGVTPRAHFITQEDLGGAFTSSVREAVLTNSPPVTLLNRGRGLIAFLPVILALKLSDREPAERQLYELAELGKPDDVPTRCPRFLRLTIQGDRPSAGDVKLDFRDEILGMIYDRGSPRPKRAIEFAIEVSDAGRRTLLQNVVGQEWQRIGTLSVTEAAASYNGDFVVHFHHPPWRKDRNDPGSVVRRNLRPPFGSDLS